MLFNLGDILLKSTTKDDPVLKNLIQDSEELYNMSEARLYPDALPLEFIFVIEKDEKAIGEISLKNIKWFNRKAELSIFLAKEYQGSGYGLSASQSIIKFAFEKMNLHRLEAEVIETNGRSHKLIKKLGFTLEGEFREAKYSSGKYWSIFKYGLLKQEYMANKGD